MDWIEQLFGISPDAASGSLEALIAAAIGAVVVGVLAIRGRRSKAIRQATLERRRRDTLRATGKS